MHGDLRAAFQAMDTDADGVRAADSGVSAFQTPE